MPHTLKVGKTKLTISNARLVRRVEQLFRLAPAQRGHAVDAAEKRLNGKHPREGDGATVLAVRPTHVHRDRERLGESMATDMNFAERNK